MVLGRCAAFSVLPCATRWCLSWFADVAVVAFLAGMILNYCNCCCYLLSLDIVPAVYILVDFGVLGRLAENG